MRIAEAFAVVAFVGILIVIGCLFIRIWMDAWWLGKLALTGLLTFLVGFVGTGVAEG